MRAIYLREVNRRLSSHSRKLLPLFAQRFIARSPFLTNNADFDYDAVRLMDLMQSRTLAISTDVGGEPDKHPVLLRKDRVLRRGLFFCFDFYFPAKGGSPLVGVELPL